MKTFGSSCDRLGAEISFVYSPVTTVVPGVFQKPSPSTYTAVIPQAVHSDGNIAFDSTLVFPVLLWSKMCALESTAVNIRYVGNAVELQ
jgi:hypothetical protein